VDYNYAMSQSIESNRIVNAVLRNTPASMFFGAVCAFETIRNSNNIRDLKAGILPSTNYDTLDYALRNHTGDFFNGYMNTLIAQYVFDLLIPRASNKLRLGLSTITGAGSMILTESAGFLTTPDMADIPAGILGSVTSVALGFAGIKIVERMERYKNSNINS
jgi:hypothetical protein